MSTNDKTEEITPNDQRDDMEDKAARLSVELDKKTAECNELRKQLGQIRKILRLSDFEIDDNIQTIIDSIPKNYE